ncbi:paraquat-inducible protein A [Roseobacter sp. GAI101]|nr:paraquat-inducible protein A [Roseobacter sp. GAI101]
MADIFLIALYITIAKGIGIGRLEVAWGLYLFTGCILASLWVSWKTQQTLQDRRAAR